MKTLKIGDKIYKSQYGALTFIGVIERVTNANAFTKVGRFKLDMSGDKTAIKIPSEKWGGYYFVGDEKTNAEYKVNSIRQYVSNFDYSKLDNSIIEQVYNLIHK